MKIAIVSDAWLPQVNGVVRTLQAIRAELEKIGHEVVVISPDQFRSVPCPTYHEIRLAIASSEAVGRRLAAIAPDAIHISTEGPLGFAARRWCLRTGRPFTTAYHTKFPDYIARRTGLSPAWVWPVIRRFHAPSCGVLATTPAIRDELRAHGIANVRAWSRGVDLDRFSPDAPPPPQFVRLQRPILLYVGRLAVEKNVEAFLACRHPGAKVLVGDGPARAALERDHPEAVFLGALSGEALAGAYAGADVFVFPSRTDTFGLVMLEALACGTPVAAFPVTGPLDVLNETVGCMDEDLDPAIAVALDRDRAACRAYAGRFGWTESARQFLAALAPLAEQAHAAA